MLFKIIIHTYYIPPIIVISNILPSYIRMYLSISQTIVFQKPFTALVGSSDDQISRLKLMFLSDQAGRHEVQVICLPDYSWGI